jgi:DNA-binding response OmpR family regulator
MRLLLVEDSERLRGSVAHALRHSGYAVDDTGDGQDGLWMATENTYDVVILDIMLPGLDGLSILDRLRAGGKETPVLFLTARDTVSDRVEGLRRGADDYLIKPFALEELLARIDALARRAYQKADPKLTLGDLELDTTSKSASRAGTAIDLTAREYAILEHLMLRQGAVVSRTEIEEHIYDEMVSPMSNVVDSAICTLRRKIAVGSESAPLIHTRRGQGYVMELKA